jgi:hypothetical protein
MRNEHKILVGKPEGKTKLVKHRCRWEYNIKLGIMGKHCVDMG